MDLKPVVIPSYTRFMKTAISVPDDIFADANVTALVTLDKSDLDDTAAVGELPGYLMHDVDGGLRLVLSL